MKQIEKYLSNGFYWRTKNGLMKGEGKKEKCIANAVPIVISRCKIDDHITNTTRKIIEIQYQDCYGRMLDHAKEFKEEDIMSGRFLRERPIEVRIDGVGNQSAINIFRNLVQAQAQDVCITREDIYAFGWYEKHFHWLDPNAVDMSQGEEYGVAVRMADLLANGNRVVTALALASVHGPLKHVLQLAGIQHDFITFIVGESSVGKTSVARILCSYHEDRSNVLALSSDRKGLKKVLQGMRDTTVVIDDFAQSSSDRVVSNQLQTISEIIQTSSDAGNVILDETSFGMSNRVHLVATGEKIIRNPSTMNRCRQIVGTTSHIWKGIRYLGGSSKHSFVMWKRGLMMWSSAARQIFRLISSL